MRSTNVHISPATLGEKKAGNIPDLTVNLEYLTMILASQISQTVIGLKKSSESLSSPASGWTLICFPDSPLRISLSSEVCHGKMWQ